MKKTFLTTLAILAAGVMGASALPLTPADADWQGSVPGNPDASDVSSITGNTVTEVYRQNVGGSESGSAAGSYTTTFSNTETDPEDATIEYNSGTAISGNPIYLLVKDGNQDPIWYIFDITGWNGTDTIEMTGFWPNQGAISHVAILTGGGSSVPDAGTTLALMGLALMGLEGVRRKVRR